MKRMKRLYAEHRGKVSDKWSLYFSAYDRLMAPYRSKPVRLLEIGVQNGGSLEIWLRYFANAEKVVGCDINPNCGALNYDDPRISVVIGDVDTDQSEEQILSHAPSFDIVIDDGSHRSSDIVRSFARYFRHLKDDGIYVVEDMHCGYWEEYEGGCNAPHSSVSFFKRLADLTNFEHFGTPITRSAFLEGFGASYGIDFDDDELEKVNAVEFSNSLCIVRKGSPSKNTLGTRFVAGDQEPVMQGVIKLKNTKCLVTDQLQNPWGSGSAALEVRYFDLLDTVADLQRQMEAMSRSIAERDEAIGKLQGTIAELQGTIADREEKMGALDRKVSERDGEIQALSRILSEREGQIVQLNNLLREIFHSRSWRWTGPLRSMMNGIRDARRTSADDASGL